MTSSYVLQNIQHKQVYQNRTLPFSPLGGLEDTYLRLVGECRPGFKASPLGDHPENAKICTRIPDPLLKDSGCDIIEEGTSLHNKAMETVHNTQGYHRSAVNLYDTTKRYPDNRWNPQYYSDRRTPFESELLRRDYLHWPIKFRGTGIKTLRTPLEGKDKGRPFFEYGYSFSPDDDPDTGERTATSLSQTRPPPKYDVTQLYQPYITYKRESRVMGNPQDFLDTTYFKRIV